MPATIMQSLLDASSKHLLSTGPGMGSPNMTVSLFTWPSHSGHLGGIDSTPNSSKGHLLLQLTQRRYLELPWISRTFRLPAARWRLSMFWVISVLRTPILSSSAKAVWPGLGSAPMMLMPNSLDSLMRRSQ